MYWIITAAGEIVNLAHASLIRVHSADSLSGKHEVRAWIAGETEDHIVIYRNSDRAACVQFVTDIYLTLKKLQEPPQAPVPDRAPGQEE